MAMARAKKAWIDYKFVVDEVTNSIVEGAQVVPFTEIADLPEASQQYEVSLR